VPLSPTADVPATIENGPRAASKSRSTAANWPVRSMPVPGITYTSGDASDRAKPSLRLAAALYLTATSPSLLAETKPPTPATSALIDVESGSALTVPEGQTAASLHRPTDRSSTTTDCPSTSSIDSPNPLVTPSLSLITCSSCWIEPGWLRLGYSASWAPSLSLKARSTW
jgi:hypothetical protein